MAGGSGRIVVTAVGACTVLGRSARRLAIGWRAGAGTTELARVDGQSVAVARAVEALEPDAPLQDRLVALATSALAEATLNHPAPLPAIVAVPDVPRGGPRELELDGPGVLKAAVSASGVDTVDVARSTTIAHGYAAGAIAMKRAWDVLRADRGPDAVVVGGVDSWLQPLRLRELLAKRRAQPVHAPRPPKRGALVPGEAAAFMILERERSARAEGRAGLAVLGSSEVAELRDRQARVSVLAALIAKLIGASENAWLLSDINGEAVRTNAWAAAVREARDASGAHRVRASIEQATIARELGDVGAATGAVAAVLATVLTAVGERSKTVVALPSLDVAGGFTLEPCDETMPAAAPMPRASSALSREAGIAFRVVERALRRFRAIEHRVAPARRAPILVSASNLGAGLAAIEEDLAGEVRPAVVARLVESAGTLVGATARARKSAERRGRAGERAADDLARVASEIGERAVEWCDLAAQEEPPPPPSASHGLDDVPLLVSRGAPRPMLVDFRAVVRRPNAPAVDVEADLEDDDIDEDEELDGAPAAAKPAEPPAAALGKSIASECIDAIGGLWLSRTPRSDGRWSPAFEETDGKLLAQLDYLGTLAAPFAFRRVPPVLADVPIDLLPLLRRSESAFDPGRAFANTLVLSCATDPRLARAGVAKARGAPCALRPALVDALSLGTSPGLDEIVAELCLEDEPSTIALGLEVLRKRRSAPIGAVVPHLFHASPAIREAAALALGVARARAGAIRALETRLTSEPTPRVQAALIESLLRLRAPHAEEHLLRAFGELVQLGPALSDEQRAARLWCARLGAALGRANDAVALASFARSPAELECLGWFGRATGVAHLLEQMEGPGRTDHGVAQACARALVRITGLVPDAAARGAKLVDGRLVTVDDDRLELDARVWRANWQSTGGGLGTTSKYRFGRRFDLKDAVGEHVANGVRVVDRNMTALEIALTAPVSVVALDNDAWAGSQLAAMRMATSR